MNQSIDPAVLSLRDEGAAHPHAMDAYWMPFTANRQFKKAPRLLAKAAGIHFWTPEGREVLDGIAQAQRVGLGPIKVNMVVKRGTNDHEIVPMARYFRENFGGGIVLRFIEYMDVGATNGWRMDEVLPSAQVIARLQEQLPLVPLEPSAPGETAQR